MSQIFIEKWKTKPNGYNFFKYSLIFAFSTILAENKYIFTYLIRISIKITQNKYTYQKKVSRRNPVSGIIHRRKLGYSIDSYLNYTKCDVKAYGHIWGYIKILMLNMLQMDGTFNEYLMSWPLIPVGTIHAI